MSNKFVILAHPRSGSYHLRGLLDSCADIVCDGEIFKPERVELRNFRLGKISARTPQERDSNPAAFLDELHKISRRKHFGFKVFRRHIENCPALSPVLAASEWKTIILYRDLAETYASNLRAAATSIWTYKESWSKKEENILNSQVHYTPETLQTFVKGYKDSMALNAEVAATKDAFVLTYNQIGHPAVMSEMLKFVGSTATPDAMTSEYQKQFTRPFHEAFDNWHEFSEAVSAIDDLPSIPTTVKT